MDSCIRFGVSLSRQLLSRFDKDIKRKGYPNRSEAIRDLIRNNLVDAEWEDASGDTTAAVILIYDHHKRGGTEHLTNHQHKNHDRIIATMHAPLDHNNCLEVVFLRGTVKKVKEIL